MKEWIVLTIVFFVIASNAQSNENLFDVANEEYRKENYKKSIENYEKIINDGFESLAVYFNLANAYYKKDEIAKSIFFYEKALIIDPSNGDVKNNLDYVNRRIIDSISVLPKSIFEKIKGFFFSLSIYDGWAKLSVIFSSLGCFFLVIFFFIKGISARRCYFIFGLISIFLCLSSLGITFYEYNRSHDSRFAIVFADRIVVKNSPMEHAIENFILHEGTKVQILDTVGSWNKIRIADGQVGWLASHAIKGL